MLLVFAVVDGDGVSSPGPPDQQRIRERGVSFTGL